MSGGLPVPFDTFHRNDQPEQVRIATDNRSPVVVAETPSGIVLLLDATELDACGGSIDLLVEAIEQGAIRCGLTFTARSPS